MALKLIDNDPGGQARILEVTASPVPEVVFAANPRGDSKGIGFHFLIEDRNPPASVPENLTLTLRFFDLMPGGEDPSVCRPAIRPAGKSWNRLRAPTVRQLPDGQPLLSWIIPYPVTPVEIAFCHPYGPDELQVLLQHSKGYWHAEAIGLTRNGQILTRLDNRVLGKGGGSAAPRGIYLIARRYVDAAPGSWVLDGILEGFSRSRPGNAWCIWAVPFANLDGVSPGDGHPDPFPDSVRHAGGWAPLPHETCVLQHDLRRWATHCRPELVLDLHASDACEHDGLYLLKPESDTEPTEANRTQQAWVNVLHQGLGPEYAADTFYRTARPEPQSHPLPLTDFVRAIIGCSAFCLQVPYALCGDTVMTPKQYREAGRRLARAILNRW